MDDIAYVNLCGQIQGLAQAIAALAAVSPNRDEIMNLLTAHRRKAESEDYQDPYDKSHNEGMKKALGELERELAKLISGLANLPPRSGPVH
ncbi:hypothetical protein [Pseudomonas delhiensis]|uniref:hypothetical protein n=1 Tax=Pseudomonas delhiensis TaxID=366289 RepID=UPI00315A8ECA